MARRLGATALAAMVAAASLTVASPAPASAAAPAQASAAAAATQCKSYRTVNRTFYDQYTAPRVPFMTVQFTNMHVCYDGTNVWFKDDPQFRVYIGSNFSSTMQAACSGVNRTPTDPTNTARRTSVYITCNAVFSNKGFGTYLPKAEVDLNGSSEFRLPGWLNAGLNLGSLGAVAGPTVADQTRYYTIRIYPAGTYEVSGVGNAGRDVL